MFSWHVAITKPFSELIAERHLEQQAFQAFNPKCLISRIVRNRQVMTLKPYFPGYCFINFDPDLDGWQRINSTRGIQTLIYASPERPARVPVDVMDVLISKCSGDVVSAETTDQHLSKLIPIGATVRVSSGPLEGRTARVAWSHNQRVAVLLSFLGVPRRIELPSRAVDVVASQAVSK